MAARSFHGGGFESIDLAADGLTLMAYGTEPASDCEDKLRLLASWAATLDHTDDSPGQTASLSRTNPRTPGAADTPTCVSQLVIVIATAGVCCGRRPSMSTVMYSSASLGEVERDLAIA